MSKIDLIDKLHTVRDLLLLLDLAAQSLSMKTERNGMQRGLMQAEELLTEVTSAIESELEVEA
jgi:hypothetical protein